jgi:hypothetical protein
MDGVPRHIAHAVGCTLLCVVLLALTAGKPAAGEASTLTDADPALVTVATEGCVLPAAAGHAHAPGDPAWIGHTEQELAEALGPPSFSLGKPMFVDDGRTYEIDVYTSPQPSSPGCIDAYVHNPCGAIYGYYCR